jgi:VanZ family protein
MRLPHHRWLLLLILLLVPFLVPIPEVLERRHLLRALGHQLHVPLILGLTLLLHRRGPLAGRLLLAAAVAAAAGGAVEIVQQFCGRHARLRDFGLDLIGVGLAVAWELWRLRRSRPALIAGLLLLLSVPAQLASLPTQLAAERAAEGRFPRLADFETRDQRHLWGESHEGGLGFGPPAGGGEGRVLRLRAPAGATYPGVIMRGFPADWSAYATLEGRARLVEGAGDSLPLVVRLDDWHGYRQGAWAARRIYVTRHWQPFHLPLTTLKEHPPGWKLNRQDVYSLVFYSPDPVATAVVELDDLQLR